MWQGLGERFRNSGACLCAGGVVGGDDLSGVPGTGVNVPGPNLTLGVLIALFIVVALWLAWRRPASGSPSEAGTAAEQREVLSTAVTRSEAAPEAGEEPAKDREPALVS